jgi:hypothetical protein
MTIIQKELLFTTKRNYERPHEVKVRECVREKVCVAIPTGPREADESCECSSFPNVCPS